MQIGEVIRAVSLTLGGLFLLFFVAPWLYKSTFLTPVYVDSDEWANGSYVTGAIIVFAFSLIAQILWLGSAVFYKGDDREAKTHEKYWYLGLVFSGISLPAALFFTTLRKEGSWEALPSLTVIFALAIAMIYWLATALSTPGCLKFIVPYSLELRRFFKGF